MKQPQFLQCFIRCKLWHILLLIMFVSSGCANPGFFHRSYNYLPENLSISNTHILLMPFDIQVLEFLFNEEKKQNMEWTKIGEENFYNGLINRLKLQNVTLIKMSVDDLNEDENLKLNQLIKDINSTLSFIADAKNENFSIRMKKDITNGDILLVLKEKYNIDYSMMLFIRNEFSSSGKIASNVMLGILGAALLIVTTAGGHPAFFPISIGDDFGYVVLMDNNTGRIIWFSVTSEGIVDVRTQKGALETIENLFKTFPD